MSSGQLPSLNERAELLYFNEVYEKYFRRADEDYVAARLLFSQHLYSGYLWMAQQALEKYLKSGLLMRCRTIRHDHCLKWHLKNLQDGDDIQFPRMIEAPTTLAKIPLQRDERGRIKEYPFREELSQFIARLSKMGGPDSRYNMRNFKIDPYDLVKFDLVAKLFRDATVLKFTDLDDGICDTPPHGGTCRFGRVRLTDFAMQQVRHANYAYWPNNESAKLLGGFAWRSNEGWKNVHKNDQDFNAALRRLATLTVHQNTAT